MTEYLTKKAIKRLRSKYPTIEDVQKARAELELDIRSLPEGLEKGAMRENRRELRKYEKLLKHEAAA